LAKIIGNLGPGKRRGVIDTVAARLNEQARLRIEGHEGEGLRRLLPVLERLPDHVTVILRPTLGFLRIDCCLIGPGRVLVVQTLHWSGKVTTGQKGQWLGGVVDLGRPDRLATVFCDRLRFSGHVRGFELVPVVLFTAGSVELVRDSSEITLVPWEKAEISLGAAFPSGLKGFDSSHLVNLLQPTT
jgi:hypothetical protein